MADLNDPTLQIIVAETKHEFELPTKRINEGHDLSTFLTSTAYHDILTFLRQLNYSMFAEKRADEDQARTVQIFDLSPSNTSFSPAVLQLQHLLSVLSEMIGEVPPDPGPRRFGNLSFCKWCDLLEQRACGLLDQHLPDVVRAFEHVGDVGSVSELQSYFVGAFGSAQRLDYGTGHELSFLAFLGGIWKLGGFKPTETGEREREIVIGVIQPLVFLPRNSGTRGCRLTRCSRYLELVRKLIKTYTLEPAGSHGVWGLDDHSFLPYIFGSAQLGPSVKAGDPMPVEGSRSDAPKPSSITNASTVAEQRTKNMYFSAIGFIYDVKKGPFWEHSRYLYDISGIEAGWGKINKVWILRRVGESFG